MRIGIIAGNRLLPIVTAQVIKKTYPEARIIAVCFNGETNPAIKNFCDKTYWLEFGKLGRLIEFLKKDAIINWVMAGQINPARIFNRRGWDAELTALALEFKDFRPHTVFTGIIDRLEKEKIKFLSIIDFLNEHTADNGVLNGIIPDNFSIRDIDFGVNIISRFVELDAGQTIVVKNRTVLSFEAFEGTDRAISRAGKLAGRGATILKFSKAEQDTRFDLPIVGTRTLQIIAGIGAKNLVLETGKVIILEKERFLSLARKYAIAVIGKTSPVRKTIASE